MIKGSDYVLERSYDQTTQKNVYHFVNDETARVLAPLDSTYDVSVVEYGDDVLIEPITHDHRTTKRDKIDLQARHATR